MAPIGDGRTRRWLSTASLIGPNPSTQETMMPSRGKKKTTMAKLNRESKLRERKAEKEARKNARRHAAMFGPPDDVNGAGSPETDGLEPSVPSEPSELDAGEVAQAAHTDA
jgi:hypothetical protein